LTLATPILSALTHQKDPRSGRSFDLAIACLNNGVANKKIWNVEVTDAKFTISNGVDRALNQITERHRQVRDANFRYEDWMNDFSGYCSFNQAKGRIARLTKNGPKFPIMSEYLSALEEVVAIWNTIQSLKPFIVKGRRPNENKTEAQIAAELKNTGICAICARRQKLDDNRMVHHGYQMSDYNHSGYRIGKCFGTGYLCYELSNEANVAYAPVLKAQLKGYQSALKTLKSGTVLTFSVKREKYLGGKLVKVGETLLKGTTEFDTELDFQIGQTEQFIKYTKSDIKDNDARISGWTLQPLKYGGR
jgi:hypothetical protein